MNWTKLNHWDRVKILRRQLKISRQKAEEYAELEVKDIPNWLKEKRTLYLDRRGKLAGQVVWR